MCWCPHVVLSSIADMNDDRSQDLAPEEVLDELPSSSSQVLDSIHGDIDAHPDSLLSGSELSRYFANDPTYTPNSNDVMSYADIEDDFVVGAYVAPDADVEGSEQVNDTREVPATPDLQEDLDDDEIDVAPSTGGAVET